MFSGPFRRKLRRKYEDYWRHRCTTLVVVLTVLAMSSIDMPLLCNCLIFLFSAVLFIIPIALSSAAIQPSGYGHLSVQNSIPLGLSGSDILALFIAGHNGTVVVPDGTLLSFLCLGMITVIFRILGP